MSQLQKNIVIIGAGQAAAGVARGLRGQGYAGSITVVGDELHPPYERPPLSKEFLAGASGASDLQRLYLVADDWWAANEVTLMLGCRAERIDREHKAVLLSDGRQLDYDILVLATGGRARRFALAGTAVEGVEQVRTADDALALGARLSGIQSLCVIGGGFLGLEIAGSARQMGREVIVLEAGAHLLPKVFPAELSGWLKGLHASRGIELVCEAKIDSIAQSESGNTVISLDTGRQIVVDCVVACVGMEPNDRLAAEAGLRIDNGVVVDAWCRTIDPSVYAVGDVASQADLCSGRCVRSESWQNAEHQAAVCAAAIAGVDVPPTPVPWFWSDQLGKNIQMAGAPLEWDALVWRGSPEEESFAVFLLHRQRLVGGITVNLGREMTPLRQLIQLEAKPDPVRLASAACTLRSLVAEARAAVSAAAAS